MSDLTINDNLIKDQIVGRTSLIVKFANTDLTDFVSLYMQDEKYFISYFGTKEIPKHLYDELLSMLSGHEVFRDKEWKILNSKMDYDSFYGRYYNPFPRYENINIL